MFHDELSILDIKEFFTNTQHAHTEECVVWTGKLHQGYGYFCTRDYRKYSAHHVAYELAYGPIPEGKVIHHTCERKWCVRPEHLKALTPEEHRVAHRKSQKTCRVKSGPRTPRRKHPAFKEWFASTKRERRLEKAEQKKLTRVNRIRELLKEQKWVWERW